MPSSDTQCHPHLLGVVQHGAQRLVRGGGGLQAALQLRRDGMGVRGAAPLQVVLEHLELQPVAGLALEQLPPHHLPLRRARLQHTADPAPRSFHRRLQGGVTPSALLAEVPLLNRCVIVHEVH